MRVSHSMRFYVFSISLLTALYSTIWFPMTRQRLGPSPEPRRLCLTEWLATHQRQLCCPRAFLANPTYKATLLRYHLRPRLMSPSHILLMATCLCPIAAAPKTFQRTRHQFRRLLLPHPKFRTLSTRHPRLLRVLTSLAVLSMSCLTCLTQLSTPAKRSFISGTGVVTRRSTRRWALSNNRRIGRVSLSRGPARLSQPQTPLITCHRRTWKIWLARRLRSLRPIYKQHLLNMALCTPSGCSARASHVGANTLRTSSGPFSITFRVSPLTAARKRIGGVTTWLWMKPMLIK